MCDERSPDANRRPRTRLRKRILYISAYALAISAISLFIASDFSWPPWRFSIDAKALVESATGIGAFLSTMWALQAYWRLVEIDADDINKIETAVKNDTALRTESGNHGGNNSKFPQGSSNYPLSFHRLAQSHKQWAQLWFSWCVAIFLGAVMYTAFTTTHSPLDKSPRHATPPKTGDESPETEEDSGKRIVVQKEERENIIVKMKPDMQEEVLIMESMTWPYAIYAIFRLHLHHAFVYLLFVASWFWAAKHYRSHWHNFVINAYRHRALYRIEQLQEDIRERVARGGVVCDMSSDRLTVKLPVQEKAEDTLLDLYRISGILLLVPGDSSYLDSVAKEDVSTEISKLEDISKTLTKKAE